MTDMPREIWCDSVGIYNDHATEFENIKYHHHSVVEALEEEIRRKDEVLKSIAKSALKHHSNHQFENCAYKFLAIHRKALKETEE